MVVQVGNLRGPLGIRRMDKVPNARIWQLCGVTKGWTKKIGEDVLRWFGVEGMENDRIAKRIYVGECAGSHSVGSPPKKWINTREAMLEEIALDVRRARRMVHDRSVWLEFVRGNAWGIARGMNPWPWQDATALWSPGWAEFRLLPTTYLVLLIFNFRSFYGKTSREVDEV